MDRTLKLHVMSLSFFQAIYHKTCKYGIMAKHRRYFMVTLSEASDRRGRWNGESRRTPTVLRYSPDKLNPDAWRSLLLGNGPSSMAIGGGRLASLGGCVPAFHTGPS